MRYTLLYKCYMGRNGGGRVEGKVLKNIRMERRLVARINRRRAAEGMTFSQFMRTAAIQLLKRKGVA